MNNRLLSSLLAAALLTLAGCEGRGDIQGQVTLGDKIVRVATVTVWPKDGIPRAAVVDQEGKFAVKDVPAGDAIITVTSPDPKMTGVVPKAANPNEAPRGEEKKQPNAADVKNWMPLPSRYSDVKTSDLKLVVKSGSNEAKFVLVNSGFSNDPGPSAPSKRDGR
ncbi:MAG: carboxypeptidase-like regulatory domain-containing protein [Gemmataceae bacterium]|nr:carboxypeptidase-like regulatory domain-containing protein [Gemmataceae bacterium]